MRKIKLITDSTVDLTKDILDRYDIDILPIKVTLGDKSYSDGEDITCEDIVEHVNKTKELPKTAAPSGYDFETKFNEWIEKDCDIIYMGIGAKMSSSYMSATLTANSLAPERIHVIDSQNLSTGTGLLACKTGDMIKAGCSTDEIVKEIKATIPKVRSSFIVDTIDYLYMGGRCSAMANFAAGILKLRPRLVVKDGAILSDKKYRGNFDRCLDCYISDCLAEMSNIDKTRVFVTDALSEFNSTDSAKCIEAVKTLSPDEILYTHANCVVFSHCGPRTLGILYIDK